MKYLVVFFLLLLGYTFIYAGLSHFFPDLTVSQSSG